MSSLTVEEDQKWLPTHVQVTVLRGRGLRGKGKHGTSDVYTIIQLGKEKYSTGVAEKTTEPEWREECSFELHPGVLDNGGGRSGHPAGSNELVLTVMHRALMVTDMFLGQAVIQLDKLFLESRCVKNEWYRLNSKTGKKEKERGEIQVTVQFTRNNLTASMYDLVMKDKTASTFVKLKERIKGKRRSSDEDSSSAVLPGGYGTLCRMRQRLPSDGGGEEDYEDDEGGEARRSKMRTFFLRGKLRKSSDTRSSTSLGSESSESSSRGGSLSPTAGISVVVSDLSNSPSNSSNLTADNSPEHTANTSPKSSSSLKCEYGDDPGEITIAVPLPTVCVNGSHAYDVQPLDPGSGKPAGSLGLGLLQKSLPLSMSLQNLSPRANTDLPKGPVGDGRRWSFDKPGEEEKAAIAAALEQSGPMLGDEEEEEQFRQAAPTKVVSSAVESESQGKKQRRNLFSHGRSESAGKGQSQSRDESEHAPAVAEEKHRGWFGSKDLHSKPSSRPPIATLFPQASNPNTTLTLKGSITGTDAKSEVMAKVERRPLPPTPTEGETPLSERSSNPFMSVGELEPDSEWDESFEAFAAGRLQSPEDLTTDCKTQQNTPSDDPLEHCNNKGALLPVTDDTLHHQPCTDFVFEAHKASSQVTNTNMHHFDSFAQFLETIPEHTSFESENTTLNTSPNSSNLAACTETNQANNTANTNDTNMHQASSVKLNSSSPDPGSSGLGSSAEEDFLSCVSSYSDKFSASSSEEAEAQNFESLNFEKSSESTVVKPSESEDDIVDRSKDLSLVDVDQHRDVDEKVDLTVLETSANISLKSDNEHREKEAGEFDRSLEEVLNDSSVSESNTNDVTTSHPSLDIITSSPDVRQSSFDIESTALGGKDASSPILHGLDLLNTSHIMNSPCQGFDDTLLTEAPKLSELQPKSYVSSKSDNEHEEKDKGESNRSLEDFSKVLNDSSVSVSTPTNVMTPVDELCSTHPSLHIITSSPEVRQSSSDVENTTLGRKDASSPLPFGFDLLNTSSIGNSPSKGFDDTLLHTQASDLSSSSFLQSLYVSVESQDYETCVSHPASEFSMASYPNESLHSANSTLCGELSEIQMTADAALGQPVSTNACKPSDEEVNQTDQAQDSGAEDRTATLEPSFMIDGDFGFLPVALTDSQQKITEGGIDEFSKCPLVQSAPLHRSHSEGDLTPALDEVLLPSFGSDPGAIQEFSPADPCPDLPSLTSFAPSLTPDSSSFPVALCSLSPLANATARSPPSVARAAVPIPIAEETQQEQAANQENSPHPVKPLTTAMLADEKRTEGRSVLATGLEKLKSTIHPGRSSQLSEQETDKKKCLVTEGAGSYYHLNHSELVALLVQRETELERQKAEYERQKLLLAKREVELRKLKPQVRDLEDYIDTLLVRIMEQKPTLLQVRSKLK
ncbi:uncharacterized protein rab11fip5a isoform X2 [Pagrus major]|uniref:uncharacterized protein rab11fip5a isoform X2 n=1 Tax=Pagrus major TaxID=143350 RepID=UPI003CC8DF8F